MTNKERVLSVLMDTGTPLCDSCLTGMAQISTRQVTYMLANELRARGVTVRETGTCGGCGKQVLCSRIMQTPGFVLPRPSAPERRQRLTAGPQATAPNLSLSSIDPDRSWYWEANIRAVAVEWLAAQGWMVVQAPNPVAEAASVDIIARQPPRKELWIVVKGLPEGRQDAQARHWFAEAIFDLIAHRDRNSELYLALALPDGNLTYTGLTAQTGWLKRMLPFTILWVTKDGRVRSD